VNGAAPTMNLRRPHYEPGFWMRTVAVFVWLTLAVGVCGCTAAAAPDRRMEGRASTRATVAYAVDGDTLRVRLPSGELAYVRLVGIDTPEDVRPGVPTECGAEAAAASMDHVALEGAAVLLRRDSVADATDRYGRILAHAFIDGRQLEVAQLRRGWAEVYRYDGQRFDGLARFDSSERFAAQAGRGVWRLCGGDFHSSLSASRTAPRSPTYLPAVGERGEGPRATNRLNGKGGSVA
jgi:micrococcal nuclease